MKKYKVFQRKLTLFYNLLGFLLYGFICWVLLTAMPEISQIIKIHNFSDLISYLFIWFILFLFLSDFFICLVYFIIYLFNPVLLDNGEQLIFRTYFKKTIIFKDNVSYIVLIKYHQHTPYLNQNFYNAVIKLKDNSEFKVIRMLHLGRKEIKLSKKIFNQIHLIDEKDKSEVNNFLSSGKYKCSRIC